MKHYWYLYILSYYKGVMEGRETVFKGMSSLEKMLGTVKYLGLKVSKKIMVSSAIKSVGLGGQGSMYSCIVSLHPSLICVGAVVYCSG